VVFLHESSIAATGTHAALLETNETYRSLMEAFEVDREAITASLEATKRKDA